ALPREKLKRALAGYLTGGVTDGKQAALIEIALGQDDAASRFNALCGVILTKKMEVKSPRSVFTKGVAAAHPVVAGLVDVRVPQGSETLRILEVREALKARRIYERSAALLRLADVLFRDFDKRKREHAGLDFDDLIETTGRLLTRRYAAEWVLWKLHGGLS